MAALLLCLPAVCQTASMFRGNLQPTGVDASGRVEQSSRSKWKFQTGGPVISFPAVADEMVYFGSGDGNVYALAADSGLLRWKFSAGDVVHASPAVSDGVVFIASWDSYFYALDAATGKQRGRCKTGEDPNTRNQVAVQSSAAGVDGTVYFGCRDSSLYALDAQTGVRKWAFNYVGSTDGCLYVLM